MKHLLHLFIAAAIIVPLFGCAYGTDYVKVERYTATSSDEKPGQDLEVYVLKAEDNRSQPEYVGKKAAGYVALEPGINLTKIMTDSVSDSLESYGYIVKRVENMDSVQPGEGKTAKVLNTSIDEFWTDFVPGYWSVDASSRMRVSFELVEKGTDRVVWKKKIGKGAKESSAMGATPSLFEDSLNNVFKQTMDTFREAVGAPEFKNGMTKKSVSYTE
jgi:hypothetical protein